MGALFAKLCIPLTPENLSQDIVNKIVKYLDIERDKLELKKTEKITTTNNKKAIKKFIKLY